MNCEHLNEHGAACPSHPHTRLRLLFVAILLGAGPLGASEDRPSVPHPWSAALSTGWDSLYMFRGVNQLPGLDGYGSSLSWTGLTLTWGLTPADSVTVGTWTAFGIGESDYKELDAYAIYSRTMGDLSLSFSYALYAVLSERGGLYANELNVSAGYALRLGEATLTPALVYAFNLGPAPGTGGYVEQAASYLEVRIDADLPLPLSAISLAPWAALGTNFRYNTSAASDPPSPFVGTDHAEVGFALPVVLHEALSIAPYAAASFQWRTLADTRPATFWAGASVTVSF